MRVEEFKGRMNFSPGEKYGLIAEEVATILPELVHTGMMPSERDASGEINRNQPQDEYQLISYSKFIPILIKAVQEQQAEIEAMKSEIASLKAR